MSKNGRYRYDVFKAKIEEYVGTKIDWSKYE